MPSRCFKINVNDVITYKLILTKFHPTVDFEKYVFDVMVLNGVQVLHWCYLIPSYMCVCARARVQITHV